MLGRNEGPLKLGNLHITRDWGYAPDYVYAMWLIMQYKVPCDFLICSGNAWSLNDLVNCVFNILQLDINKYVVFDKTLLRPKDLEIMYGDNTKAKDLLGWNYNMTNEELIKQLLEDEFKFVEWELKFSNSVKTLN